jgi:hypothetical protein
MRRDHEYFADGEGLKNLLSKEYRSGQVSTVVARGRCFSVRDAAASGPVYSPLMAWANAPIHQLMQ